MVKLHNPALHEEPINKLPSVIPLKQEESILEWLQNTGHLVSHGLDTDYYEEVDEEEELTEFLDDTNIYALRADEGEEEEFE
jgi:Protein of unknown function (DUF3134)